MGEGQGEGRDSDGRGEGQGEVRALCFHSMLDVRCSMFDVSGFVVSLLSTFRMRWDHEPGRRNGARLCEPQHAALQTKLLRATDSRSEIRFTEREGGVVMAAGLRRPPAGFPCESQVRGAKLGSFRFVTANHVSARRSNPTTHSGAPVHPPRENLPSPTPHPPI